MSFYVALGCSEIICIDHSGLELMKMDLPLPFDHWNKNCAAPYAGINEFLKKKEKRERKLTYKYYTASSGKENYSCYVLH